MRTHVLKTWPEPFQAVLDGRKRYEIRVDDRGFAVGDALNLKEWEPTPWMPLGGFFTGRECNVRVLYMTPGGAWGMPDNLCVMSIELEELCCGPDASEACANIIGKRKAEKLREFFYKSLGCGGSSDHEHQSVMEQYYLDKIASLETL